MPHSTDRNRRAAVLLFACLLAIGSRAIHAAEAPVAFGAPAQNTKGLSETTGESGGQRERSREDALALLEILRTADAFDPTDWDNQLVYLAPAARRFPDSEELARSLFRALGPKPQILSAEFDPADGHIVHMVTQDTVVRTDAKLAPIPDWVLDFVGALAGDLMLNRTVRIDQQVLDSSATDVWTRQAKAALAERIAASFGWTSHDHTTTRLGSNTYNKTCAICHGRDGRGIHNQAPPLAGSEWALAAEPNRLVQITLHGLRGPIKVRGKVFDEMVCPPIWGGGALSDVEIAATLTHIRSNRFWGHALPPVSVDEVKAVRDASQPRYAPWTAAEFFNPSPAGTDPNPQSPSADPNEFE